jgi:hypothetical protein
MKQDLPAVCRIRLALDKARQFQPIDQLDRGVVAQREAIREFANRRMRVAGKSFERQQSLMLLRLDPMLSCLPFAELKKTPELVSKLGQLTVVG